MLGDRGPQQTGYHTIEMLVKFLHSSQAGQGALLGVTRLITVQLHPLHIATRTGLGNLDLYASAL